MKNMETKQQIRTRHLAIRNRMSEQERAALSMQIADALWEQCERMRQESSEGLCVVRGYYPHRSEVSLLPFYSRVLKNGIPLAFPGAHGENMEFYYVESMQDFKPGAFGILEPAESCRICLKDAGICLTPGSVFDLHGNRYGYGKGYYDRYFLQYPGLCRTGIAYENQLEADIPVEQTDIRMQYLITEQAWYPVQNRHGTLS